MLSYVFEVQVAGTVRVRAADETEARKVVPAVLLLPVPMKSGWPTTPIASWGGPPLSPRSTSVLGAA